ncbi:MAG: CDP-diacylglycerol--glycerol-3-phosphate 3-phosphatidyltransferase [Bacteroidetes bacterium]|nr:CDP-diacylglycerol--glycerol-3-phosphate 3-phosphatidyltransferase [Bacteroidota bacterium]MCY4232336.1 CDP-diacylglycerol--glycerol-3-phosphate 3-phosphatidyltransferase [Bacteroidota bacterium]
MQFIPNAITILRILVTPFLIACLFQQTIWYASLACALFLTGAISDYVDGYVARTQKTQTKLGRHLDPVADKVFVMGLFISLAWLYPLIVPWWAVGVIILRDVFVTGLRLHADSKHRSLPTLQFAKLKTVMQMGYLGILLILLMLQYYSDTATFSRELLYGNGMFILLSIVVLMTCLTGLSYLIIYFKKSTELLIHD